MSSSPFTIQSGMSDLELALQASIARKQRQRDVAREAADATPLPRANPDETWIPLGQSAYVQGFATRDLVYVAKRLPSFSGSGIEPGSIDPSLAVDAQSPNTSGEGLSYWPSYASISAASRAAYLQWLQGGRVEHNVNIGYVFIFFYGLERRVYELVQRRGWSGDDLLCIANEVARLLDLHASRSNSFASYGERFLDLLGLIESRARSLRAAASIRSGDGISHRLAIALGEHAAARRPLPAALAFDYLRAQRAANTTTRRCASQFELLFHIRYAKQFGEGIHLEPGSATLDLTYRPASSALEPMRVEQRNIPDVTHARLLTKIETLGESCSSALEAFSRFLGKSNSRDSLAAFALLPDELVEGTHSADAKALAELVLSRLDADGRAQLGAGELLQYVRLSKPGKVAKNEALLLAQSLEKLGYGMEPDVRLGGPVLDLEEPVIVFRRLPDCPSAASDEYALATICMRLGTMVSAADDDVSAAERALLERHIADALQLSAGERQRLGAHLAWLVETKPGTAGLKKRLETLSADARHHVGQLLVSIAVTDAHVDPREMKILEKLYDLLGLDATALYRDVHTLQASDEPVVVETPRGAPKGFVIPPRAAASDLDMARVRLRIEETRQVSALLGTIFVEEEAAPAAPARVAEEGTIGTLDAAHSAFLRRLAERASWPREDVERLASELALMTDGALETINDYAYTTANEPLWEDEDPVTIHTDVAKELIR